MCLGEIDVAYVAAPTADVASGEVAAGSAVKLTAARGTVYYAIGDGEYQKYTGDITINEATTIKAYAEYVGSTNTVKSTEATFTYTIAEATE